MSNSAFAETLIEDYLELGFGIRENANSIRSFSGDTVLSLEPTPETKNSLDVFSNGDLLTSLSYEEPDFSAKLIASVAAVLNL